MKYLIRIAILASAVLFFISFTSIADTPKKMNNDKVTIEVWSDIVCPFCLIGKKKLGQAIEKQNAQDQVEIIWRSFQLDPEFPKSQATPGMQNLTERKRYPANQVHAMCGQLTEQGKAYSIHFNFDSALTINTWDAHRLIQWSKEYNKSHQLKEALMTAHFSKGADLSTLEGLINVTNSVGLNSTEAVAVLASDRYSIEVSADIMRAQSLGIRGVPYFLIDGKQSISGAQSDAVFEQMIQGVLRDRKTKHDSSGAGVCLPNGECD